MAYEADMALIFDPVSGGLVVSFRGKISYLTGPFEDRKAAVRAGEDVCRKLGWKDI
ncbi:hypothetical protein [Neorhizobium sp. P12A]|uniref:hypothetical protein n=1 Tax=Neorhizobium sp. P12A TaxID=2268027 RepID=UPI00165E8FB7|nr:hypothetical protein [Neorhizobium sp. P12A]